MMLLVKIADRIDGKVERQLEVLVPHDRTT